MQPISLKPIKEEARMSRNKRHQRQTWEHFRFALIGPLLADPPEPGQLTKRLANIANKEWKHPLKPNQTYTVSVATLERWYYAARRAKDPVLSLRRKQREDNGSSRCLSHDTKQALKTQYQQYGHWSYQLHYDNLKASQADVPSYSTVRRYMKTQGWYKKPRLKANTVGAWAAQQRLEQREVRSFEVKHVNALWHLDFHYGSHRINHKGEWKTPILLSIIDDRSRLICHLQWYWAEDTEMLVHGFIQALQKRGLPRALMTDNGSAMMSEEFTRGLSELSILHEPTLPYSPYQNAKQETFWSTVEGRLMAMLTGVEFSLEQLNEYTQVWVERDYHRNHHSEIDMTPLQAYTQLPDEVSRACPDTKTLRRAFCRIQNRKQRRSDGTISLLGKRFEIPNSYRHFESIDVRYASWDLSTLEMIVFDTGQTLAPLYPLDKTANADGIRKSKQNAVMPVKSNQLPPLLEKLMREHHQSGLPLAYLPKEGKDHE